jgi:hypothetical protein
MTAELPEPSVTDDVWGLQLNTAISGVEAIAAEAAAAAASNVNITDVDDDGNPIVNYGNSSATVLLVSALGKPGGAASLDGGGQIPLSQIGNINPTSIGAAAAQHTHALADIPEVVRALDASPAIAVFNTTSGKWPARNTITTSTTRTVIWWGDADIPSDAKPNVDLFYGPTARSGSTVPTPPSTPPPTSDPDPVTAITRGEPVNTVNSSLFNIRANCTNGNTANTFTYLQLAVRGPNGENGDTGYNSNVTITSGQLLTVTGSGSAGVTGVWKAYLTYNIAGTAGQSSWVDGPSTNFTIAATGGGTTPPPAGDVGHRTIPLIGRSGLAWNSGVFYNAGDPTSAQQFATWRGRKLDSIMYFPGRTNYDQINWRHTGLNSWPGYRIVSVPAQPANQNNNTGNSATGYNFWAEWGRQAKAQGWDDGRTIVRLNWEANGNWYPWAWYNGGASLFVNTYKNVVNAIRSTTTKMLFNLTVNRANVNGGITWNTQVYDPLIAHYDIIGLDWYDDFPAMNNLSSWNSALAANPGPTSIASYCRSKGKMMWLDEWGLSHRPDAGSAAGGDDPYYMGKMFEWCTANSDVLAGETYYEDDGTNGQYGRISGGGNPNGAAAYWLLSRWCGTGA